MGNDAGDWCLIESDPGVFTELINGIGVQGVQVEELYSIEDEEHLEKLKPIYGLIFLFKWRQGEELEGTLQPDAPVYFAKQVITNACASQAIINLLLNINSKDVTLGNTLENFKAFTQSFDAGLRGLTLSNSEEIRKLHNSFSREHYMEMDLPKTKSEDNFHFIAYVPVDDKIYELDGLRDAPIFLADIKKDDENSSDWIDIVRPYIKRRIEKYTAGEIHFNLMALVPNLCTKYEQRIAELSTNEMDSDEVAQEISHLQNLIEDEKDKMKRYKIENNRRRHNYMPFLIELLKCLAKEGKLVDLVKEAQEKKKKICDFPSKKKLEK
ncbi:Ubiquitin carboxyl-terminal hydrolase [Meloidogyne graminicola]|uniref:Ubiquitin carboxyl-terminal hydrolase n=1 Tax=Meloidogyne graminicola TaxID=189291 RepID=A0A8T0A2J6_9BILA|nr:Ubiquitin carboxyl-terminal hydrolase [Meloidogyne graminicola]